MAGVILNVDENMKDEDNRSPTEVADDSGGEESQHGDIMEVEREHRKRHREAGSVPIPVDPSDAEHEIDSPSKRANQGEEPMSARELRELLSGHVREMKTAWQNFQGRLAHIEGMQEHQGAELDKHKESISHLKARTKALEKDAISHRQANEQNARNLDVLTEEVKNMKVQWEMQSSSSKAPGFPEPVAPPAPQLDPWAQFLRQQRDQGQPGENPALQGNLQSGGERNPDVLTEDEKRTLIVGGWLRDTRRSIIEAESATIIGNEDLKKLLDAEKLTIYGPRRSVGMLKFKERDGESFQAMRERMWDTIKFIAAAKHMLPSTKETGDEAKPMWASFVKTKTARVKSSLVSMVRRVCCALALDAKTPEGGVRCLSNTQFTAYDCDWNLGTIWCDPQKLAGATHKAPREGEHVLMSGGWVSLEAVAITTGCSIDEAKAAFEREL